MNKKRLVSMLLVSAMTAALFTGCGSDETRHPETVQRAQEPTVPQKKQASKNSPHFLR